MAGVGLDLSELSPSDELRLALLVNYDAQMRYRKDRSPESRDQAVQADVLDAKALLETLV